MKIVLFISTLLISFSIRADDKISIKDKDLMSLLGSYSKAAASMQQQPTVPPAADTQPVPGRPVLRSPRQDFRKSFQGPQAPLAPQPPQL